MLLVTLPDRTGHINIDRIDDVVGERVFFYHTSGGLMILANDGVSWYFTSVPDLAASNMDGARFMRREEKSAIAAAIARGYNVFVTESVEELMEEIAG